MPDLAALRDRLRLSLWFLPSLFALGALALAFALLAVDRRLAADAQAVFLFGGTAEGARSMLSTIAQSMLTFTGLVFTITMLVLQLASSQLSPRVMRTFLRDRKNQVVLGLFVATFVYTLLVLREVRSPTEANPSFVPGLSIWVAFVLLLGSVGAFVYYIDHMAHAIRASTVIENIARETRDAIDRLYPEPIGMEPGDDAGAEFEPGRDDAILDADRAGVLLAVDEAALLEAVKVGDRRAELLAAIGDWVPEGAPLFRLWGRWDRSAVDGLREAVDFGSERTLDQDATFGFRQLVDVAIRALSPGTNDPSTAVQALDRIHDLLRRLAGRRFPSPERIGGDGTVRLVLDRPGWDDYVRLAVDEIRLAGENQLQIVRRLREMLEDLASIAPEDRREVVGDELARLDGAVARAFAEPGDRLAARQPSARGHGGEEAIEVRTRVRTLRP